MKRLRMLTLLLLFSLSAVLLSGSVQAKPKLDGKPVAWAMCFAEETDDDEMQPGLGYSVVVTVKNASRKATFSNFHCTDKRLNIHDAYYDKKNKVWKVACYSDVTNNVRDRSIKDFTVSFDVKDGSAKTHLKTRCKYSKWNIPFEKLKIGGVNVLPYLKKTINYAEVPLAGKKVAFSYKLKKGYSIGKPFAYGAKTKLKAGDVIEIPYGSKKEPKRVWIILVK